MILDEVVGHVSFSWPLAHLISAQLPTSEPELRCSDMLRSGASGIQMLRRGFVRVIQTLRTFSRDVWRADSAQVTACAWISALAVESLRHHFG